MPSSALGQVNTPIIPVKAKVYATGKDNRLDNASVALFAALGFFLDDTTYFLDQKVLKPGHVARFSADGTLEYQRPVFTWSYEPRDVSFEQTVDEFGQLFERITKEQLADFDRPILPLSGGLDSRTQAVVLKGQKVLSYSYAFERGLREDKYGWAIARKTGFQHQSWTVPPGYLWDVLPQLAAWNGCYSEFTHPRQMAFTEEFAQLAGDVFFLGHWGDVLFDDMGVPDALPFEQQVEVLLKKVVKKGGLAIGRRLWEAWGLDGHFEDFLRSRLESLLGGITIDNANARIRAFKSMYWAPRWTSVNLCVFRQFKPVALPFYHDDMCRFICTVPERYLAGRKIQIAYIKRKAPELARIPWQAHRPFNLYSYPQNKVPWNLPYRVWKKMIRTASSFFGHSLVQRNWELQFLGEENDRQLRSYLFDNQGFSEFVPEEIVRYFYKRFREVDPVEYAHPVSMLLTLAQFWRMHNAN